MIDETVDEIEDMRTHSSSVVAIRATEALRELLEREYATVEEFVRDVERNSSALRRANPSHASLFNAQHEVVDRLEAAEPTTIDGAKRALESAIESVVRDIEIAKDAAADHAAELLDDGDCLLTHDFSSTVLGAIERVAEAGSTLDVFVTEARPRYLGRKTARTLSEIDGISATLIVDSATGYFLEECDYVLTGMTCIVDGTLYNRVGTFPIMASAQRVGTPTYVTGSSAKIVREGFRFENDFRSPVEVLLEPTEGISIANPAYDATPVGMVDSIITDDGVEDP